jgi:chemotaxis protein CheD
MNPEIITRYPQSACHYLMVGDGGIWRKPSAVQTVLGSCVSVTFHVPRLHLGATFHALLPERERYDRSRPDDPPFKYVDAAVDAVCARLFRNGLKPADIECKVFGGANATFRGEFATGRMNVEAAFKALARHHLRAKSADVGGDRGRKLLFLTDTGEVFIRRLKG